MNKKHLSLFIFPILLIGCNNSNVNMPKSPFNDSYNRIGMNSEYNSSISTLDPSEYEKLKTSIDKYDEDTTILSYKYTRKEETRDLKAAYFGTNLGAANLCSLTSRSDENIRYENNVTTKLVSTHKENQVMNGSVLKSNEVVNDYIYKIDNEDKYYKNQYSKTDDEPEIVNQEELTYTSNLFNLSPYTKDIKNNFGTITVRGKEIIFNVLDDVNEAVYGKTNIKDIGDRFIIKEAKSVFADYSTTVGDTYKAVNNFFYEALLDSNYRFTNFRFYTEMLILSEAVSDDEKVPVLYLDKPQLVEYSEIKYTISYDSKTGNFDKGNIPQPK